jgi:hypothetical protein
MCNALAVIREMLVFALQNKILGVDIILTGPTGHQSDHSMKTDPLFTKLFDRCSRKIKTVWVGEDPTKNETESGCWRS